MPPPAYMPPHAFGGFWIRLGAYLIDSLIVMVPGLMVQILVYVAFGHGVEAAFDNTQTHQPADGIASLGQTALYCAYWSFFTVTKGGTLGKLAVGLRVVGEDGMHLGWGRAIGRYFAMILSCCLAAVGCIMIGFHEKKRGLHDLICGTYVVRKEWVNPAQGQY